MIRVAILLGCSPPIMSLILKSGSPISPSDVATAATLDRPEILTLLLQHTIYTPSSFDVESCSDRVKATLKEWAEQQEKHKQEMLEKASEFTTQLLNAVLSTALTLRLEDGSQKQKQAREVTNALVGDCLFYVLMDRPTMTQDGEELSYLRLKQLGSPESNFPVHPSKSLLLSLPDSVLAEMDSDCTLTLILRLVESHLMSKEVRDVAVGLGLVQVLLAKASPHHITEMDRYGILDLASSQVAYASSMQFSSTSSPPNTTTTTTSSAPSDPSQPCPDLYCRSGHCAVVHVTRHASFRCDMCGKGVEQGVPMHGCRRCDWDACEACTDKAEGGVVKWK